MTTESEKVENLLLGPVHIVSYKLWHKRYTVLDRSRERYIIQ